MLTKKSKYDAVCYPGTSYALLLYLLIEPYKIERTFFIADDRIPESIAQHLNHYRYTPPKEISNSSKLVSTIRDLYGYLKFDYIWAKNGLKSKDIYGMDHIGPCGATMSRYLLHRKEKFTLLEDGIGNYNMPQKQTIIKQHGFKHKIVTVLKQNYYPLWGTSERISEIYLTGIQDIPNIIKDKVSLFDLKDLWDKSNNKELIKKIFNVNTIKNYDKDYILILTQPQYRNVNKHIELYKDLTMNIPENKLIIKPHPSTANINYKKYFPEAICLNDIAYTPIELLFLIGLKIEKVLTITSSASSFLKRYTNVETHIELFNKNSIY